VPAWLAAVVVGACAGGVALGAMTGEGRPALQVVRAVFFASAFAYLTVSTVDFWEHLRLEKQVAGRWLAWVAVPPGETVNHLMTTATLALVLLWARPLPARLEARDWFVLTAPVGYFVLGWIDELIYHRRRAVHREDLMHTVSHLAGGAMLAALYAMRLAIVR
jgi:hypothetical protein